VKIVIGVTAVKVVLGQERSVFQALKRKDGIKDVYHVFGEYDFFVIMQGDELVNLSDIMDNIREIYDVTIAQTILVGRDGDLGMTGIS
jgi:DNA-binding Lrp family transcriptional regulator